MKRTYLFLSAFIVAVLTAGFVSSCSSADELNSTSANDNKEKQLTLTIKTQELTKAAASADPNTTNENTMNRITIGIFDQAGTTVRAVQEFSPTSTESDATAGSNLFYNGTNGTATVSVVTTQLTNTDQILVAVNAPASLFTGVSTAADFKKKILTAEQALYTKSDKSSPTDGIAVSNNIPMLGTATVSGSGTNYSATVKPIHLASKVTLESLKVEFASDGPYSAATFTPTEIFIYNAPDGLTFDDANPYISTSTYLTGESSSSSAAVFLSTGDISTGAKVLSGTNTFGTKYYFYTTPNNNVDANKTKLVIKGQFDPDGSGSAPAKIVYYPVKLNSNVKSDGSHSVAEASTNEYQVYPNKNYKCSVTIKTIGSANPGSDIDPTTATVTINVVSFTGVDQSTIFQ